MPTLREQFWDPVAGFGVTFRTMFKKVVTEQYPFEKMPTAPRFHGRHQLNRWPDGLEKCIGCELCAWACPADAIYVEGASNTDDDRFSPGERYGRVYQINYLRCILCGLCIEACPTRALTMTNEYELADNNRADLIYEKSDLLAPLLPGMEQPPHPMRLGDDEGDYYRGNFSAPQAGGPRMTFWILAPIMVAAALGILFVRKAVHAAMLLALVAPSRPPAAWRVDGLAHEEDAERGGHRDRSEDPEGHSGAPAWVRRSCRGSSRPRPSSRAASGAAAPPCRGAAWSQRVGLLVDQVRTVVVRELVLVGHRERPSRAGLNAPTATVQRR